MFANPDLSWADIAWLREQTCCRARQGRPHPGEDARRALDAGVDGLIVSNHGGRQLDGAIAALDALPGVVGAVPGEVLPCCSTAASARAPTRSRRSPSARGPCSSPAPRCGGSRSAARQGVRHVLRTLLGELDNTLAMAGYRSHHELAPGSLAPRP